MRRGGRALYALDISTRESPKFMWKIDPATTGFDELGETWSTPAFARMRASSNPVLIFAAGYDAVANDQLRLTVSRIGTLATAITEFDHGYADNETVRISGADQLAYNGIKSIAVTGSRSFTFEVDATSVTPATGSPSVESQRNATMGRGVFFVDATDGSLIRSFTPVAGSDTNTQVAGMDFSIPGDAIPLNTDLDAAGYADRLYFGDLGGNIWRFDIDSATPINWAATKLADLTAGATPRRKVFTAPAVVKQNYLGERFDAVYVGTGDRENPLRVDNRDLMFMIKDKNTGLSVASDGWAPLVYSPGSGPTQFYDLTENLVQTGSAEQQSAAASALKTTAGWVMRLETGGTGGGEKLVNNPVVFFNVLRFGTYSPVARSSQCVPQGLGTMYAMSALDGSIVADTNGDGVLLTSGYGHDSRAYSASIRGFPGDAGVIIRDKKLWVLSGGDGQQKAELIGRARGGQRVYWSQEAER